MTRKIIGMALVLCLGAAAAIALSAVHADHDNTSPLAQLAETPGLPEWAPVPMINGQIGAVEPLKRFLADKSAPNRARAVFLIGQVGSDKYVGLIKPLLDDKDSLVRLHAAITLASMGDSSGIPGCRKVLNQSPGWLRVYAVYGLWSIGSAESTQALQSARGAQTEPVRTMIDKALGTAPHKVEAKPTSAGKSTATSASDAWMEAQSIYVAEGDWWFHHGDYEQCIRCHMTAAFFDPANPENYSVAGYLLWSLGRNQEADRMLADGVKAAPKDPDTYFNQGFHFYNTKRYGKAEAPLRTSVKLKGDHRARRTYAHCLEKLGKLNEALQQWGELKRLLPKDGTVLTNYNRVRAKLKAVPNV